MPLFADVTPNPASLGEAITIFFYVAGALAALVVAFCAVWTTFFKQRDHGPGEEYVTRAELDKDIGRLQEEVKDIRKRFHDVRNHLHAINLKIVWMMGLLVQVGKKFDLAIPSEPVIRDEDEA